MAHSSRDSRNSHNNYQQDFVVVVVTDIYFVVVIVILIKLQIITITGKPDQQSTCWFDQAGFLGRPPSLVSNPHRAQECHTAAACCWETCIVGIRLTWNYLSVGARWRNSISPGSPLPPPTPILDLSPSPQAWTDLKWWAQSPPSQMWRWLAMERASSLFMSSYYPVKIFFLSGNTHQRNRYHFPLECICFANLGEKCFRRAVQLILVPPDANFCQRRKPVNRVTAAKPHQADIKDDNIWCNWMLVIF